MAKARVGLPGLPVLNDLFIMDVWEKLPCAWRSRCAVAGGNCDHFLAQDCSDAKKIMAVAKPATICPFLGQSLEQIMGIDCGACRACESEKPPTKICAVCRRLEIDGKWTDQKFAGIQTSVPYVFCDTCRIPRQ